MSWRFRLFGWFLLLGDVDDIAEKSSRDENIELATLIHFLFSSICLRVRSLIFSGNRFQLAQQTTPRVSVYISHNVFENSKTILWFIFACSFCLAIGHFQTEYVLPSVQMKLSIRHRPNHFLHAPHESLKNIYSGIAAVAWKECGFGWILCSLMMQLKRWNCIEM